MQHTGDEDVQRGAFEEADKVEMNAPFLTQDLASTVPVAPGRDKILLRYETKITTHATTNPTSLA